MRILRNNKFTKIFRNFIGFKPAIAVLDLNKKNVSTSDAFFGEQTIILRQYLNLLIFIIFFSKNKALIVKFFSMIRIIIL